MSSMSLTPNLTTAEMYKPTAEIKSANSTEKIEISDAAVKEKAAEENSSADVRLKKEYSAISENGDTVELSEAGKKLEAHSDAAKGKAVGADTPSVSGKKIITDKQLSDTTLAGYSKSKLKKLYMDKQITKQRYERIMKKKDSKSMEFAGQ